jgi:hypothetical protein
MQRSDLPFGGEFSSSHIDLRHVLEVAAIQPRVFTG